MSKLHLKESEKNRILNLHRNFVDVPGRRLNEQEISPGLDSLIQMGKEHGFDTVKDAMKKFMPMDHPQLDVWKKVKEGLNKWITGKMVGGADIPPMDAGDTFVEWWAKWPLELQEQFMDSTGLDRETIESVEIGMNAGPGSPIPMNEEDWMQKADKDIEKRGTEGVFHKWCVDRGYKDGCSKECWAAAKKEGSPWSRRAGLAKAFCESKH